MTPPLPRSGKSEISTVPALPGGRRISRLRLRSRRDERGLRVLLLHVYPESVKRVANAAEWRIWRLVTLK